MPVCLPESAHGQLLRAFHRDADNDPDVIAADQFPVIAPQAPSVLFLRAGAYRVELEQADGTRRILGNIDVGPAGVGPGACLEPA